MASNEDEDVELQEALQLSKQNPVLELDLELLEAMQLSMQQTQAKTKSMSSEEDEEEKLLNAALQLSKQLSDVKNNDSNSITASSNPIKDIEFGKTENSFENQKNQNANSKYRIMFLYRFYWNSNEFEFSYTRK